MKKKSCRPQSHDSGRFCRWCHKKVGPVICPICKEPVGYASTIEKERDLLGRHNRKAHKKAVRDSMRMREIWEKFEKDHGVSLWHFAS